MTAPLRLARLLSILGHPVLLTPLALLLAGYLSQPGEPGVSGTAIAAAIGLGMAVMLLSLFNVRSGAWSHVDASAPGERRQLNRVLALLLGGATLLAWYTHQPLAMVLGLACSTAVACAALVLRRYLKLSLHAAFAVYAAALLWPAPLAAGLMLLLALAVGWSRLLLQRHSLREVGAGFAAGALAGLTYVRFA